MGNIILAPFSGKLNFIISYALQHIASIRIRCKVLSVDLNHKEKICVDKIVEKIYSVEYQFWRNCPYEKFWPRAPILCCLLSEMRPSLLIFLESTINYDMAAPDYNRIIICLILSPWICFLFRSLFLFLFFSFLKWDLFENIRLPLRPINYSHIAPWLSLSVWVFSWPKIPYLASVGWWLKSYCNLDILRVTYCFWTDVTRQYLITVAFLIYAGLNV